jgi:poly(A) polymerase
MELSRSTLATQFPFDPADRAMTDREFALEVVRQLQNAGFIAYWAGGCVRDELLGLKPQDYDVATSARPEQLRTLFPRRNEIGASFGVVQVIGPRGDDGRWLTIEVATFRSDVGYSDGRRPDAVVFSSPQDDAQRRDFTINGMFFDPIRNELIDYVGGQADLRAKVLRAIGNPFERFTEDKLRILRAVRIAARFDLTIDSATFAAARQLAGEIRTVSAERIAEELRKLLTHPNRTRGVKLFGEFGLVPPILPELAPADVWTDGVTAVSCLETGQPPAVAPLSSPGGSLSVPTTTVTFPLALAAWLHRLNPDEVEAIGLRLRLSNAEIERTAWLVENQTVLNDAPRQPPSQLYPRLTHPGIAELLALHRALARAKQHSEEPVAFCEQILRTIPSDHLNPPVLITGNDLKKLGLKPGPAFKPLLDRVRAAQLDQQVTTKDQALVLVQRLIAASSGGSPTPLA